MISKVAWDTSRLNWRLCLLLKETTSVTTKTGTWVSTWIAGHQSRLAAGRWRTSKERSCRSSLEPSSLVYFRRRVDGLGPTRGPAWSSSGLGLDNPQSPDLFLAPRCGSWSWSSHFPVAMVLGAAPSCCPGRDRESELCPPLAKRRRRSESRPTPLIFVSATYFTTFEDNE